MKSTKNIDLTTASLFTEVPTHLKSLFDESYYPWMMLNKIKEYIAEIISSRAIPGFSTLKEDVLIGENCEISDLTTIDAPAIIGSGCKLRPGAYIRGNVIIGDNCVIGNSCELKNCIILNNVQIPHFNYVGDSIIGNRSHLGAGAICSNVKSDKSLVTVNASESIPTGMKKLGAILSDDVEIGCGTVLNPGTVVCRGSRVYPLTALRGVIPARSIVKSINEIVPIR